MNKTITKYTNHKQTASRLHILLFLLCLSVAVYAQKTKEIVVLHTNDTHSRIEPTEVSVQDSELSDKGGYVRRATFIQQERAIHPELLLFDSGDFSQGTPYYNIFQGEVEIRLMNAMGYDAVTIGNHEFDLGMENLLNLCQIADFPFVCANYDFTGTLLEEVVKPYTILKRNGLKIGVFGLGPVLEGLVQAKNYEGIVYEDANQAANRVAEQLKKKEKCDYVICLSHLGWKAYPGFPSDEDLITNTRYIDLVLGGHSHSLFDQVLYYKNLDGEATALHQSGKNGMYIGRFVLKFNKK